VDVAHDVERPVLGPPVGPQRLALDGGGLDLLDARQVVDPVEALPAQGVQRPAQLPALVAQHMGPEVAVGPGRVARGAHRLGDVDHDGHRQRVVALGQGEQGLAGLALHVGGVDHGEAPGVHPLGRDEVEHLERRPGGALVVLVVGHQAAAEVGRDDLGGPEVAGRERRLARPGHADQHDEADLGDREGHRRNTAIWVGAPWLASSGPMPACSTA
jgi:hypothetical protein